MIGSIYYLQQQFLVGELDMSHATNLSDGQMQRWNLVQGINCRPVCREATARVHCTLHGKLVVAAGDWPPQEADHVRTGVDQVPTARSSSSPGLLGHALLPH